jgi:hypothetical protein
MSIVPKAAPPEDTHSPRHVRSFQHVRAFEDVRALKDARTSALCIPPDSSYGACQVDILTLRVRRPSKPSRPRISTSISLCHHRYRDQPSNLLSPYRSPAGRDRRRSPAIHLLLPVPHHRSCNPACRTSRRIHCLNLLIRQSRRRGWSGDDAPGHTAVCLSKGRAGFCLVVHCRGYSHWRDGWTHRRCNPRPTSS